MSQPDVSNACNSANPDAPVPYVFGREIARGGMGSILETEDCRLGRKVAVKIMLWEAGASPEQQQRFINEAAVLGMLEHPNIVPIHDIGRDADGQLYYSMKLVKGRTLQSVLNDIRKNRGDATREFSLERLLAIFRKICDALAFAHSRGIIHRDLKPENVMVGEFGEVLVMDWGLAKNYRNPGSREGFDPLSASLSKHMTGLTMEGVVMGTPNYMSPEQAAGHVEKMGPRSDIFSLGGILYAVLTLHPPVEGDTLDEVLRKVTSGLITPPSEFGTAASPPNYPRRKIATPTAQIKSLPHCPSGRVPAAINAVTMKALALRREDRYQNVEELAADIEAYQNGFATTAENAGAWRQAALLIKRHKAAALSLAACLLALASITSWFTSRLLDERNNAIEARKHAEDERSKALAAQQKADEERQKADDQRHKAEEQRIRAESESKRAQQALAEVKVERARAVSEGMRAEQAAGDLKMTAPTLFALAKARFSEGKFDEAIAQIAAALKLDATNIEYHLFQAGVFEIWLKPDEAIDAYRRALSLSPGNKTAEANITLCRELSEVLKKQPSPIARIQHGLVGLLRQQQRSDDALVLEKLMQEEDARLADELDALGDKVLMKMKGKRLFRQPDGSLRVVLDHLKIFDLSILEGKWVSELSLDSSSIGSLRGLPSGYLKVMHMPRSKVFGLAALRGQPLEVLTLDWTSISDLADLHGLPLSTLSLRNCWELKDIGPLASCQSLTSLDISETKVADISALATCRSLKRLMLSGCRIADLAPLEALQLTEFVYFKGPYLDGEAVSLAPLRSHPLTVLHLGGTRVADFLSLRGSPTLEEITLPYIRPEVRPPTRLDAAPTIQALRHFPHLKKINVSTNEGRIIYTSTYDSFWKAVAADTPNPKPGSLQSELRRLRDR